jgi:hypothetical protein
MSFEKNHSKRMEVREEGRRTRGFYIYQPPTSAAHEAEAGELGKGLHASQTRTS